ncbi:MAG: hypothetical protein K2W92_07770, partial [Alphaproteobacteria bacterium]|nr:hypothetical protein [Alphaproteobacteria bacterium]
LRVAETSVATSLCCDTAGDTAACTAATLPKTSIFGVSDVAVLKWIRKEANLIEEAPSHAESKIVMIDEMWHFIGSKKTKNGLSRP